MIIPAARIPALEREWDRLKLKEGFTRWHTSEFVARNSESDFAHWDDAKHHRVFSRVRGICKKYAVRAISFSVKKADYDAIVPDVIRKYAGLHHYTWAIRHVMSQTLQWRLMHNVEHPLEYVFDSMGEKKRNTRRAEIEDVMEQAEDTAIKWGGKTGDFIHWSFRPNQDVPGLQCVDALAWTMYQYGLFTFCGKQLVEDAQTAWDDFSTHQNGEWGYDFTVKPEHLREWVEKELEDGSSIRAFEKWHEQKRKREKGVGI